MSPSLETIERRLRSLARQVRCLPPVPRRELEPIVTRARISLAALQVSQVLVDERTLRERIDAARRDG